MHRRLFGVLRGLLRCIYGVILGALEGFTGKSLQASWGMCACSSYFSLPVLPWAQLWGSSRWLLAKELCVYICVSPFWSKIWESGREKELI